MEPAKTDDYKPPQRVPKWPWWVWLLFMLLPVPWWLALILLGALGLYYLFVWLLPKF
jgi:hypothetical protein